MSTLLVRYLKLQEKLEKLKANDDSITIYLKGGSDNFFSNFGEFTPDEFISFVKKVLSEHPYVLTFEKVKDNSPNFSS